MKVDVTNNTTMFVQHDALLGALIGLATFFYFMAIGLAVEAVKGCIQSINLHEEAVDVLFGEQVIVVTNSTIHTILYLCIMPGVPFTIVLGRRPNNSGMGKDRAILVAFVVCFLRVQVGVLCFFT